LLINIYIVTINLEHAELMYFVLCVEFDNR